MGWGGARALPARAYEAQSFTHIPWLMLTNLYFGRKHFSSASLKPKPG